MTDSGRYSSAAGVEAAIRDAARKAHAVDASLSITDRIRQEYFRRFLSRIFSDEHDSDWLLKGGTGMLARIASARTTTDVDLFRANRTLDSALDDLKRLSAVELDDHFRFEYVQHRDAIAGEQQTYSEGYGVTFDVYIGANRKEPLHVDLVVGVVVTGEVTVIAPAGALSLPKLPSHDYRLYPVVDQIADKVCATMAVYNGRPSSREKDLVDLVVLAMSEDIEGDALHRAIESERRVRSLEPFTALSTPPGWGAKYAKLARSVPLCADFPAVELAAALMREFIDPVMSDSARGKTWRHAARRWSD